MNDKYIYQQLALNIKEKIKSGEYKVGDYILSERKMSDMYKINRMTVRKAPFGAFFASLLFGGFESLAINLQAITKIPVEFIQMIPYITTIVIYTVITYRKFTEPQRKAKKVALKNKTAEV